MHLRDQLLAEGHVVSMFRSEFRAPNGEAFSREVVRHPGAVSVVPLLDDGDVVLVRQYRAPLDRFLLEIPAGKRDVHGEAPELTAQRELIEEVGWRAGRLVKLAEFYNSPGFSDEYSHLFLGLDLVPAERDLQGIEEQHLTVEHVPLADVPALIADGTLVDAKTIIGLSLTLARQRG